MINCLLVNSPNSNYSEHVSSDPKVPLGLLSISSYLIKYEIRTAILDCHIKTMTFEEIICKIINIHPQVVGFNISTPNRKIVYDIINTLKSRSPDLVVIVGGPHATCLPREVIECSGADGVVLGEGEETTLKIFNNYPKLTSFQGFYTKDYVLRTTKPLKLSPRISNLDSLPNPAYDLIDLNAYLTVKQELYITSGRGCYHNCAFCSARRQYGSHIEFRSSTSVLNEILFLRSKYNVSNYYFFNENMLIWPYLKSFCEIISEEKISWGAQAMIRDLDISLIKNLVESGCNNLGFGLESGSKAIQKYIGKIIPNDVFKKIKALSSEGINTRASFVIGLPIENQLSVIETTKFIIKLGLSGLNDIVIFPARPYPGTRLYNELIEQHGKSQSSLIIDSEYIDVSNEHNIKYINEKLTRYNVFPTFKVCDKFNTVDLLRIIERIYSVFYCAVNFSDVSDKSLSKYIFDYETLVG